MELPEDHRLPSCARVSPVSTGADPLRCRVVQGDAVAEGRTKSRRSLQSNAASAQYPAQYHGDALTAGERRTPLNGLFACARRRPRCPRLPSSPGACTLAALCACKHGCVGALSVGGSSSAPTLPLFRRARRLGCPPPLASREARLADSRCLSVRRNRNIVARALLLNGRKSLRHLVGSCLRLGAERVM